jgi:hypothetical protein
MAIKIVSLTLTKDRDVDLVFNRGPATYHVLNYYTTTRELQHDLRMSRIELITLGQTCLVQQARDNSKRLEEKLSTLLTDHQHKLAQRKDPLSDITDEEKLNLAILYERLMEQTSVNHRILVLEAAYQAKD